MDEQEQNYVDPRQVARYMYEMQKQEENLVKYQLDASQELQQLKTELLGLEYNTDEDKWLISPEKLRMCNDKCANTILAFLQNRVSKIISLSNLDQQDITKRCLHFMDALTFLLTRHRIEFEIVSYQVLRNIIELCDDVFYMTMMKAYNAGERDTLRKQFTHVESSEHVTQSPAKPTPIYGNLLSGVRS